MKLYLVQHGDAVAKEVDPERPLSESGREDVRRTASFLGTAGVRVACVLHSGKKRAEQTAALLARALLPAGTIRQTDGLDPVDPTDALAAQASTWSDDTMLVGHLPFMAKLASRLLLGSEARETVAFEPGAVLCLERTNAGGWRVVWMVRPALFRRPGECSQGPDI